jgi:tetratricopeptide (TPR) repeat protein
MAASLPALFLFFWAAFQIDHPAEGRKALEANNFALAAEHYQKAVEADPKDWQSQFHLALAYSFLDNKDAEAIAAYRQVIEAQPDLYEAQLNLGILLLRQKEIPHAEAVKLLAAAATKKPKEYRPRYFHARALDAAGEASAAAAEYAEALTIDPKSAEAAVDLARLLVKQGKLAEADAYYRQAAQNDPAFHRALLELAGHYETAKQSDKAIPLYREFPDDPGARERLGQLLLESGKAADAIPELENSYQQSPTNANRLALATAYLRSKQLPKAIPLLDQAVAAEPDNFQLRLYYGRAQRDTRNYPAAAREFFRAAQLKPDSQEAWNELAGMLYLLENYPQALAAFDKANALGTGENPAYWYFRAIILDRMKDYKGALPAYEKFLSLSQDKSPDEEFKARQRIKVIKKELSKR